MFFESAVSLPAMSDRAGIPLITIIGLTAATIQPGPHPQEPSNVIRARFPEASPDAYDLFISYCRTDRPFWERVMVHLRPIEREGVRIFSYDTLKPGSVVPHEAQAALDSAVAAVLLISADYLASDVMERELPDLLDRAEQGWPQTRVLRVQVGECSLYNMERLTKFHAVGDETVPLNFLQKPRREPVYRELLEAIRDRLIECGRYPKKE